MNRRSFLGGLGLLAVASACGDSEPAETGMDSPGTSGFPVSIEDSFGTATIESRPQRVVSIGWVEHDILLALGVVPIALQQWMPDYTKTGVGPWAEPLLHGERPTLFRLSSELNIGQIAKLKPDLIVGLSRQLSNEDYELLAGIAPTLAAPKGTDNFQVPYDVMTEVIGTALGKKADADRLVAKARRAYRDAAAKHRDFDGKSAEVMLVSDDSGGGNVYTAEDTRGQFLTSLGFTIPEAITAAAGDEFYAQLSPERLDLINDLDLLIVLGYFNARQRLASNDVFQALDVARQRRVFYADQVVSAAIAHNTVLSIPFAVQRAVPAIASTLR